MTLDRDLKLQIDLAFYQLLVQANRLACDNSFAREAHDNVIATLRDQRELARRRAQIKRALRLESDEDKQDRLAEQLDIVVGENYDAQPYDITPWIKTEADGSFINPVTGDLVGTSDDIGTVIIPDEWLCGLAEIIDGIYRDCHVRFWVDLTYFRPVTDWRVKVEALKAEGADEIPW